jgi:hypothetical protein
MTHCIDEGTLRAYLDKELSATERTAVTAHLEGCADCQHLLHTLHTRSSQVGALLAEPIARPDMAHAFSRLQKTIADGVSEPAHEPAGDSSDTAYRRNLMQEKNRFWNRYGTIFGAAAVVVALLSLLALPPVRALADQLLQVFRMERVVFVPVSTERMEELEGLEFDGDTLFMSEPEVVGEEPELQEVASVDEASAAAGFAVHTLTLPSDTPNPTEIAVQDQATLQFQVNVEATQQLLDMLDITDVTLPDALGEQPVTIDMPASVMMHYSDEAYDLRFVQGPSPQVNLPEGVDMALLSKTMLRVLGMDADQAQQLSQEVDLSTTFIFPLPADIENLTQVTVNGAQGILTRGDYHHDNGEHRQNKMLYWQDSGGFYVLMVDGSIEDSVLLSVAESVQ